ncbi:MAG TPA: hypothetical protein VF992_01680 [Thermoplasmata archaeon]
MAKKPIEVESWTAESLTAEASRHGKTAYAFGTELLEAALRLCSEGGTPAEILPAWKTMRLSKDVGGMPLLPRSLIGKMVDRLYATDPEWLEREWFQGGKQLGDVLRVKYPTIEDLQIGAEKLMPLVAERVIDVRRVTSEDEGPSRIRVRVETDLTLGTSAVGEKFLAGMLAAYPFQATEVHLAEGAIEVIGVYQGRHALRPRSEAEQTLAQPPEGGAHQA